MEKDELFSVLNTKYPQSPFIFTLQTIDRKKFVSGIYKSHAYTDEQVPIPNFQKTQSYSSMIEMAHMLNLSTNDTVLEIGTGSGYFTAVLFQHCKTITTIERIRNLCGFAQKNLTGQFPDAMKNKDIEIKHDNMSNISTVFEPESFSKIVCTCELDPHKFDITSLIGILKQNGLLLIPTKKSLLLYTKGRQNNAFLLEETEHEFSFCECKAKKE